MVTETLPPELADAAAPVPEVPRPRVPLDRRVLGWIAGHRLFSAVLLVAAALRLLVAVAYAPALEFFGDSYAYLESATHLGQVDVWHPFGYPLLLRVVSVTHSLVVLTLLQHVAGVATGVVIYRLVRDYGAGPVAGTVASLPVLLDAYQVDVEQFVLSDTMFLLLVVLALHGCLRMSHRPTAATGIAVGLTLSLATLTRTVGLFVALAVFAYLLVTRVGWDRVMSVAVAFGLPVFGYALAFHASYGAFGLQGYSGRYLYGTVAPFADCRGLSLPRDEQVLCDPTPTHARPGLNQYVWEASPYQRLTGSAIDRSQTAGDFARAVAMHQPGSLTRAVAGNVAHYFEPGRSVSLRDWFTASWQFPLPDRAPAWHIEPASVGFDGTPAHGRIVVGLARLLRGYQRVMYTPGPLLLLALIGVLVALGLRRPDRATRQASGLLGVCGFLLLVAPSATAGFDWRYLLPAQALILPAGVLALHAVRGRFAALVPGRRMSMLAAVVVAAVLVPGLVTPPAIASGALRPTHVARVPATLRVGDRLAVAVGKPEVHATGCAVTSTGGRIEALVAFPTLVSYRSGGPILVQPTNFALTGAGVTGGPTIPGSGPADVLPSVILSNGYRSTAGAVYMYVPETSGRLEYVDERGAGAAAWAFHIDEPRHGAPLGARCKPRTGAGSSAAAPHIGALPPFTELDTQRITYAPADNGTLAASFDVRWRQASSQSRPGDWQYPPSWQATTAIGQSLVGLTPGYTYCFSVRAHDITGAMTAWSRPSCTTRMYDDTALAVAPPWKQYSGQNGFYYRSFTQTSAYHAMLTVSGTYSRIGLVAYRCPTCGAVSVYAGTKLLRTISLVSTRADSGLMSWLSKPMPRHTGIVRIEVVSRDGMVVLDAIGLQR